MTLSQSFAAILGMAAVTYATRLAGPALLARIPMGRRGEAFLRALPGSILTALVAPAVLGGGPPEWVGTVAALVAARLGGMFPALAVGVGAVYLMRLWYA